MSRVSALVLICGAVLGCAGIDPAKELGPGHSEHSERNEHGAVARTAHWSQPAGQATGLIVFEHGFLRRCENLRGTTQRLVAVGWMALCLDASMRGGNPALAERLAHTLAHDELAPPGRALPRRILVAGHSAGALFAVTLGARLDKIASERLTGALLFDPVAGKGFERELLAIAADERRPVLALLAPPHRCNGRASAVPALRRIEQGIREAGSNAFAIVELGAGATHADVEGEDTGGIAKWACGPVQPHQTEKLREIAADWVRRVVSVDGALPGITAGRRDFKHLCRNRLDASRRKESGSERTHSPYNDF